MPFGLCKVLSLNSKTTTSLNSHFEGVEEVSVQFGVYTWAGKQRCFIRLLLARS